MAEEQAGVGGKARKQAASPGAARTRARARRTQGPASAQDKSPPPPAAPDRTGGIAHESLGLYQEWSKILAGTSDVEIPAKDPRFADSAWRENPVYHRLGQAYLSFCKAVDGVVEDRGSATNIIGRWPRHPAST